MNQSGYQLNKADKCQVAVVLLIDSGRLSSFCLSYLFRWQIYIFLFVINFCLGRNVLGNIRDIPKNHFLGDKL